MLVLHCWPQLQGGTSTPRDGASSHTSFGTGVQNPAERFPAAAAPTLQLHLAPDHVAGPAGIDLNSRKRSRKHDATERFGLPDDVFSREVIPALPEDPFQNHALHIARQIAGVLEVRALQVLGKECLVRPHTFIIVPFRIGWILVDGTDDDADR